MYIILFQLLASNGDGMRHGGMQSFRFFFVVLFCQSIGDGCDTYGTTTMGKTQENMVGSPLSESNFLLDNIILNSDGCQGMRYKYTRDFV